ncbi:MAG: class I tRNA ligase family protein, partial [Candidatus Diapherotrites archaeon]|nr:class I tRNA ligase family protein [Candidatus Diapherotrites archaeon]
YRALTQDTFIDLYHKGLIYEDDRINNYCPGCATTIADAEIEYVDKPSAFNDIIFRVKETGERIIIGTTRPELVATCAMIIYNPEDERYTHLAGKTAITPVFNREVPIKAHNIAQIDKGTGLVMMCSMGDLSDIRFFREQNLKPVIAIGRDGKMNEHAGPLQGLYVKKGREKMIELLKEQGLFAQAKPVEHRTPICERSKHEIEFIEMKEFYVKQVEFKEKMKQIAAKVNFFAPASRQILLDWIDGISIDWPISRRRYYATEVPLWYCKKCGTPHLPLKGKYYRPWKEKAPFSHCTKCKATEFIGETRVLDTWFDSSISPLYILKWSRDDAFYKSAKPCSVRPQGKEIIRTWLYYTLFKCWLLTGEVIFRDAWINYHILDEQGHKMSKSKGNVINPHKILEQFGAEPFRIWVALEGNLDAIDFRCSQERIDGAAKTLTKLWNTCRFISGFPRPARRPAKLDTSDEWILSELNALVKTTEDGFSKYDFHNPALCIKNFVWETFASHYLEMAKSRAYNRDGPHSTESQEAALWTLHHCMETLLKLLAPITPFVTYRLHKELTGKNIHVDELFPTPDSELDRKFEFSTAELLELNSRIWQAKKEKGLSLNAGIESFAIPKQFKALATTLADTHKIKQIDWA